jgi:hypothetical protein
MRDRGSASSLRPCTLRNEQAVSTAQPRCSADHTQHVRKCQQGAAKLGGRPLADCTGATSVAATINAINLLSKGTVPTCVHPLHLILMLRFPISLPWAGPRQLCRVTARSCLPRIHLPSRLCNTITLPFGTVSRPQAVRTRLPSPPPCLAMARACWSTVLPELARDAPHLWARKSRSTCTPIFLCK